MRLLCALALLFSFVLMTPVFAANPYDDVPADHWAYNSLDYLSQQGVLEGYPEGFFKGERTLTRYEFAQAVSRLLDTVSEKGASADIKVMAESLRAEFSDQLAQLSRNVDETGAKVSDLDSRITDLESSSAGDAAKAAELADKVACLKPGPEWKGTFRYRWQFENWGNHERLRHRIMFTLGYSKQINDLVQTSFRLRTRTGEDPTGSHATLGNDGKPATIFLDQAYAKVTPQWFGSYADKDCNAKPRLELYGGLMPDLAYDPYEMVLAIPVNLQGLGLVYHFNKDFQLTAAQSVAVEVDGDKVDDDATLSIKELKYNNILVKGLDAWLGCYCWDNAGQLPPYMFANNTVPSFDFNNDGKVDSNDRFSTSFRTLKGGLQYTFPCVFNKPLAVFAEYEKNLDSDAEARITAVNTGITPDIVYESGDDIGYGYGVKLGEMPVNKGDWYAFVNYKEIGANAVVNGLADSEAGGANTNSLRLHTTYMWADNSMLGLTWYLNKIHNSFGLAVPDAKQDRNNISVDWTFKF